MSACGPVCNETVSTAETLVAAVHNDVLVFANGCELPDDIALVALTWHGANATS